MSFVPLARRMGTPAFAKGWRSDVPLIFFVLGGGADDGEDALHDLPMSGEGADVGIVAGFGGGLEGELLFALRSYEGGAD